MTIVDTNVHTLVKSTAHVTLPLKIPTKIKVEQTLQLQDNQLICLICMGY